MKLYFENIENPEEPKKPNYTKCKKILHNAIISRGGILMDETYDAIYYAVPGKSVSSKKVSEMISDDLRSAGFKTAFHKRSGSYSETPTDAFIIYQKGVRKDKVTIDIEIYKDPENEVDDMTCFGINIDEVM